MGPGSVPWFVVCAILLETQLPTLAAVYPLAPVGSRAEEVKDLSIRQKDLDLADRSVLSA